MQGFQHSARNCLAASSLHSPDLHQERCFVRVVASFPTTERAPCTGPCQRSDVVWLVPQVCVHPLLSFSQTLCSRARGLRSMEGRKPVRVTCVSGSGNVRSPSSLILESCGKSIRLGGCINRGSEKSNPGQILSFDQMRIVLLNDRRKDHLRNPYGTHGHKSTNAGVCSIQHHIWSSMGLIQHPWLLSTRLRDGSSQHGSCSQAVWGILTSNTRRVPFPHNQCAMHHSRFLTREW